MKCTNCGSAEPVMKYRGEVPYWYRGHTTSIHGVNQYICLFCGYESIPPGYAQRWLEQTAEFRAQIDAQKPSQRQRPESLKDKIMIEWLSLNPDQLADEVPLEQEGSYIRWATLANYAKEHQSKAFEAFAAHNDSKASDWAECANASDWVDFLNALRIARSIAADPHWEVPHDGVVYDWEVRVN